MRDTPGLADWRDHVQPDPIAEAVAAERRRAAEAVREIVEREIAGGKAARLDGRIDTAFIREFASGVARECLAAVEGER